jgi:hypothetical protein
VVDIHIKNHQQQPPENLRKSCRHTYGTKAAQQSVHRWWPDIRCRASFDSPDITCNAVDPDSHALPSNGCCIRKEAKTKPMLGNML